MVSRRQVRRAIELHADTLTALSDVVGIGAQWDTSKAPKGAEREHAVAVYVAEYPTTSEGEQIPTSVEIPARKGVHVIPVVLKQIGRVELEHGEPQIGDLATSHAADEDEFFAE